MKACARFIKTNSAQALEYEYRPEHAAAKRDQRVMFDGGRRGTHVGDGLVRVCGDGEHYGYLGHCRRCDAGVNH